MTYIETLKATKDIAWINQEIVCLERIIRQMSDEVAIYLSRNVTSSRHYSDLKRNLEIANDKLDDLNRFKFGYRTRIENTISR